MMSEAKTPETWPVVRRNGDAAIFGRRLQLLINNVHTFLATVDVYSDGAVNCWRPVDLGILRRLVEKQWLVPMPVGDHDLTVSHFGDTGCENAEWFMSADEICSTVESIAADLADDPTDMIDLEGRDTVHRDGMRCARLNLLRRSIYRRDDEGGDIVIGESLPILSCGEGDFRLTRLAVFKDGQVSVGGDGEIVPHGRLERLYDEGRISNLAPAGSRVLIRGVGSFTATRDFGGISSGDRIVEIRSLLERLNGRPTVNALCAIRYREYADDPGAEAREVLRRAYEKVPPHLRPYCGDMDTRDTLIRAVLYGDEIPDWVPERLRPATE